MAIPFGVTQSTQPEQWKRKVHERMKKIIEFQVGKKEHHKILKRIARCLRYESSHSIRIATQITTKKSGQFESQISNKVNDNKKRERKKQSTV